MRDNNNRIILLLASAILVITAGGLWLFLNQGGPATPGPVARLLGRAETVLEGKADPTFGTGGTARIQGPAILAPAAILLDEGSIYVVATAAQVPGDEHLAVARLDAAGRLVTGYGRQGLAEVDFGGGDQVARGGLLQPDGKLIVFGHASAGGTRRNMAVARLLPDGSRDPSFDGDGLAAIRFGDGIQSAEAAGLDAAGRLTLAGYAEQAIAGETYREIALARLLPDGSLDGSFGQGGQIRDRMRLETREQALAALLISTSGEIRAAGWGQGQGGADPVPVLGQWLQGGARDSSFGLQGLALLPPGRTGRLTAMTDAGDGRTLATGTRTADGRGPFILRLLADGRPDPAFGSGGLLEIGGDQDPPVTGLRLWPLGQQLLLLQDDGTTLTASVLTASGGRLPGLSRRLALGPRGGPAVATLSGGRLWTAHAAGGDPSPLVVQRFDLLGGVAADGAGPPGK